MLSINSRKLLLEKEATANKCVFLVFQIATFVNVVVAIPYKLDRLVDLFFFSLITAAFSEFNHTWSSRLQFLVSPDQRFGCLALVSYTVIMMLEVSLGD
jgi:hypothetical protein